MARIDVTLQCCAEDLLLLLRATIKHSAILLSQTPHHSLILILAESFDARWNCWQYTSSCHTSANFKNQHGISADQFGQNNWCAAIGDAYLLLSSLICLRSGTGKRAETATRLILVSWDPLAPTWQPQVSLLLLIQNFNGFVNLVLQLLVWFQEAQNLSIGEPQSQSMMEVL